MKLAIPARLHDRITACVLRWLAAEQGRFALWPPVLAIAGDAAYFALRREPPVWAGGALLACGAALACMRRSLLLQAAGICAALFGFGMAAAQLASLRAPPFVPLPNHATQIAGRVIEYDALPDGARLTLDRVTMDAAPIGPRRLRLTVPAEAAAQPGAAIAVRAMVAAPSAPAYPGGRDLQRDAWFDGLAGYGYALGGVTLTQSARANWLGDLRDHIAERARAALPGAPGAIAATLLTGLSAAIPAADRAAFRDAGLSHLLAIAGLHIAIVMGLVLAGSRFLLLWSERAALFWPVRQIAGVAALVAGFGYLELTGLHVPTLRSFTMAALVVLALVSGRRAASLRAWGLASLAVIAIEPEQVTGASFQLSFAAVLALIAGYQWLRGPLQTLRGEGGRARALTHHVATLVLTSALAGLASIPFVAYHFGCIQLYFVVANLLAVPLAALWVMPAGLAALLLMPLGLDRLAFVPMGWGIRVILWIAHGVAGWPGATLAVPHMPLSALLLMSSGLAWLCLWHSRARLLGAVPMLAGVVAMVLMAPPNLLVSPDARLVGLREPGGLFLGAARGGDSYVQAAWQQYLGLPERDLAQAPRTSCDHTGCRSDAARPAVRIGTGDMPCDAPVLVVQKGEAPYCPGALEIDRGAVWRNGAAAVWLGRPSVLVTDRGERGDRPWVFLPPEQERARILLPFAKQD